MIDGLWGLLQFSFDLFSITDELRCAVTIEVTGLLHLILLLINLLGRRVIDLSTLCQYKATIDLFTHQVIIAADFSLLAIHGILAINSGNPSHLI